MRRGARLYVWITSDQPLHTPHRTIIIPPASFYIYTASARVRRACVHHPSHVLHVNHLSRSHHHHAANNRRRGLAVPTTRSGIRRHHRASSVPPVSRTACSGVVLRGRIKTKVQRNYKITTRAAQKPSPTKNSLVKSHGARTPDGMRSYTRMVRVRRACMRACDDVGASVAGGGAITRTRARTLSIITYPCQNRTHTHVNLCGRACECTVHVSQTQ